MKFYAFDEIRANGDCLQFVQSVLGYEVDRDGRCQAIWRGGDGFNVSLEKDKWFDHKAKEGGGIIELCMLAKFSGDMQAAQNFLGEWLHLSPKLEKQKMPARSARYDELINQGFKETKRYGYEDLEGNLVHFVARFEHPDKEKEFMQGNPRGWGLHDVTPILYRMKDWVHSSFVVVVEGEKDVDTLIDDLRIPATTNCGGADKWRPEYAELFKGKSVIVCRDNDEAGETHAWRVCRELKDTAARIVIVCPSKKPKGDVTDWKNDEGGTAEKLMELAKNATFIDLTRLEGIDPVVEEAKRANQKSLANFTEFKVMQGNKAVAIKEPRQISAVIDDVHKRFLGFPRRVGDSKYMFDHDRDSKSIVYLHNPSSLMSWIGRKSKRSVSWAQGDALITKSELFEGLCAEAQRYESISMVPDWPKRDDVYYAHDPLPDPTPGFQFFNNFVDFFAPASDAYRTLLKAFICAPLWYMRGIPRPGWIIDSEHGAGTGKTTMVELIAKLYGSSPIKTNRQQLRTDVESITKRVVSTAGRLARILLVDNVTNDFCSAELSDFMTAETISGIAPYGRGEETRPNNLTYVITSNSASVDNDLSDRCYFVKVQKPTRSSTWKRDVLDYIAKNQMAIIADIIGMLKTSEHLTDAPVTRFPEFEETILRGVCADDEEYHDAIEILMESKSDSNVEDEHAKTLEDEFHARILDEGFQPGMEYLFLRGDVVKHWMDDIFGYEAGGNKVQYLRNLVKNGLTTRFSVKPDRFPSRGRFRRRGIMWQPLEANDSRPKIIGMKGKKVIEIQYNEQD